MSSVFIEKLELENVLSFGPKFELELGPLNVLIGANASGKSNLIDVIGLTKSFAYDSESGQDYRAYLSKNGGVSEWEFKGDPLGAFKVAVFVSSVGRCYRFVYEILSGQGLPLLSYQSMQQVSGEDKGSRLLAAEKLQQRTLGDSSILVNDASGNSSLHPASFGIATFLRRVSLFGTRSGKGPDLRTLKRADARSESLDEDFGNLALILNRYVRLPKEKQRIIELLKEFNPAITGFDTEVIGGYVQLRISEGDESFPATRLSDGTLRYLCLLAILCDPDPPRLICIEEPEVGLHPDILPTIAKLLVEASERTQLIVTTHSDILVDALSDNPDAILVCEKEDGQTKIKRLNAEELRPWLKEYSLGKLWMSGQLGGTRW